MIATAAEEPALAKVYLEQFLEEADAKHPWRAHFRRKLAGKGR